MKRLLGLLLYPLLAHAQYTIPRTTGANAHVVPPAISLITHAANFISGGNLSNTLTLNGVTTGAAITVCAADRNGNISTVADSLNGSFTQIFYVPDSANPSFGGCWYHLNSAAGNDVVTVTLSATELWTSFAAQAWANVHTTGALDTNFSTYNQVSTTGTVANANCGSAKTPAGNGEVVIALMVPDSATATAGTNYTITDSNPSAELFYVANWIQTTATATNAPWVNAADDWISGCIALKP